jgi:hypothetical protein
VKLLLDNENGPIKEIQEAIDSADPGSTIKIKGGTYKSIIIKYLQFIRKPNLKFMPFSEDDNEKVCINGVYLPALVVELQKEEKVFFKSISFELVSENVDDEDMNNVSE